MPSGTPRRPSGHPATPSGPLASSKRPLGVCRRHLAFRGGPKALCSERFVDVPMPMPSDPPTRNSDSDSDSDSAIGPRTSALRLRVRSPVRESTRAFEGSPPPRSGFVPSSTVHESRRADLHLRPPSRERESGNISAGRYSSTDSVVEAKPARPACCAVGDYSTVRLYVMVVVTTGGPTETVPPNVKTCLPGESGASMSQ